MDPLTPPAGAAIGELIGFEGYTMQPAEAGNRATKAFSKIAGDFYVNDDGVATYKGVPFMTSAGVIRSELRGPIS